MSASVRLELTQLPEGVDAGGLHAELAAAALPVVEAVTVADAVIVVFAVQPTRAELVTLNAVARAHDPKRAALELYRGELRAAADLRLSDLQDFRAAALKTSGDLDTEAAAVKAQIDAAPDEAAARAIAEGYTRRKL